ncbi:MAG TPA: hypothetical protein VMW48_05860 [Vicinamibacterales bacterium]|nr:hypothetical protein [Vicinamibacterales bacterium]
MVVPAHGGEDHRLGLGDGQTTVSLARGRRDAGDVIAPRTAPTEAFAPGKRITIWHSADAPNFMVHGTELNDYPVVSRPVLPGLWSFLDYVAMTALTLLAGAGATVWVAKRWARARGALPANWSTRT